MELLTLHLLAMQCGGGFVGAATPEQFDGMTLLHLRIPAEVSWPTKSPPPPCDNAATPRTVEMYIACHQPAQCPTKNWLPVVTIFPLLEGQAIFPDLLR